MRVLVAGAGGVAGRALLPLLAESVDVVGLDRPEVDPSADHEWMSVDVRDWRALRAALTGAENFDALVDLITAPVADIADEDRARSEFDVNVAGTWTLLSEALAVGVRRLVYISTLNVYGDLTSGEHLEHDNLLANMTVDVAEPYGLAKRMAEQLFEYLCATRGATGVALRIDSLHVPEVMERRGIHVSDITRAVHLALVVPLDRFRILNLTADPNRNHAPNSAARQLLGWEPDHVFELRHDLEDWTQPISPPLGPLTVQDPRH